MLNLLRGRKLDQQIIVLILFILIFLSFAVFLPGFISAGNILTLVRSVSVLGILGLGMAIVVIGRGIDLSMIATLAVPAAWVMTLAGAGYPPVLAILAGLACNRDRRAEWRSGGLCGNPRFVRHAGSGHRDRWDRPKRAVRI
ncbi:MAG: hypothetical protein R3D81_05675 [Thalassovita sp.]